MQVEVCIRVGIGILLMLIPLPFMEKSMAAPYCSSEQSAALSEVCDSLMYMARAFGCFNFAYGLLLFVGLQHFGRKEESTAFSTMAVALFVHCSGALFEGLLRGPGATNVPAFCWHVTYFCLYAFCCLRFLKR